MKDVDRSDKRKPLTLAEVREAYEPLGEKYPPLLDLKRAAEINAASKAASSLTSAGRFQHTAAPLLAPTASIAAAMRHPCSSSRI